MNVDGGAQQDTLKGGAQQLSVRMAEYIENNGRRVGSDSKQPLVRLNCPVVAIKQQQQQDAKQQQGVVVVYSRSRRADGKHIDGQELDGELCSLRARRVIVALPPPLCSRIRFSPPLPVQRERLQQRMPMGSVIKFNIFYEKAFWREHGFSGIIMSDQLPISIACISMLCCVCVCGAVFSLCCGVLFWFSWLNR